MSAKRAGSLIVTVALLAAVLASIAPVQAQTYNPDVDLPKPTGLEKSLTKLGRGLSNVMLGWAEIPMTFDKNLKKGKPLGYLIGVAPVLGTARAVMRTGTGVFEASTFPFTDKDVNYDAILEPEYIF
ncbi:MAG: exosortase system-associated protein, TIGR04073 family [Candidatus Hydrogenedens sp.]|nr:exosortase system-associated protein, TIGR04073 family [Candidatus Hydrogenedentota bacterium]NLF59400.1 exosortase system-associated protein, TIGR04073 family [Candidatus Hydrogenedens sp.]